MCQGKLATLAVPFVQLSFFIATLVTAPISDLADLAIVLEWNEPSSVTGHLIVTSDDANSRLLQVTLTCWLLTERLLAEAVLTTVASSSAAASPTSPSFGLTRMGS